MSFSIFFKFTHFVQPLRGWLKQQVQLVRFNLFSLTQISGLFLLLLILMVRVAGAQVQLTGIDLIGIYLRTLVLVLNLW